MDPGNIAKGSVRLESRWINHYSYSTPIKLIPVCFVVSALATPNRDRGWFSVSISWPPFLSNIFPGLLPRSVILELFPAHPYDHHHHHQHVRLLPSVSLDMRR